MLRSKKEAGRASALAQRRRTHFLISDQVLCTESFVTAWRRNVRYGTLYPATNFDLESRRVRPARVMVTRAMVPRTVRDLITHGARELSLLHPRRDRNFISLNTNRWLARRAELSVNGSTLQIGTQQENGSNQRVLIG